MTVIDASAILAFLLDEPGAAIVEDHLEQGVVGAANWSEVIQKIRAHDRDVQAATTLLLSYGLNIEDVTRADAETAALLWVRGSGLSLADRLCIALGRRVGSVLTADRAWDGLDGVTTIR